MVATKEQERKALEKIEKIIADLGENSYVGTAFEGCLQDAGENIENDFALSMNGRCQYVEQQVEALKAENSELKGKLVENEKDYEATCTATHKIFEQKDAEIKALQERTLSVDDLADVIQLVSDERYKYNTSTKNAADRIVEAAGEPESAAFQKAVSDYRAGKRGMEYLTALLERLCKAKTE